MATPLGVADELFFGVPESELGRLARLEEAEGNQDTFEAMPEDSLMFELEPPECTGPRDGTRVPRPRSIAPARG